VSDGNWSAPVICRCERLSASRIVARRTLRLAAATLVSSEVSSRSLKMFHQFGSIGSGTGVLIGEATAAAVWLAANQLAGDHMVQPGRAPAASNAKVSQLRGRW
jgi:hypothetical protein